MVATATEPPDRTPVLLPSSRHLLRVPADPQRIHPMFLRLHLEVFHVCGDSTRRWEFQKLLPRFSLTCPERVSARTKLDLRHCHILPEGVEFMLSSFRKRGVADQLPKAFFARFPSNSNLCPVETLRCYLKATSTIGPAIPSSNSDPLFISYGKSHKPISAPSLTRWLRSLLKAFGVNSDIFKAHSVRGASTTAAANSSVPLSEMLKMAEWSSPSTFQKFYYKPVHSSNFAHAGLQ